MKQNVPWKQQDTHNTLNRINIKECRTPKNKLTPAMDSQRMQYPDAEPMHHESIQEQVDQRFPIADQQRMAYDDGHPPHMDSNAMEQQQPQEQRYPSVDHQQMHVQEDQDPNMQHVQHDAAQQHHAGPEMQRLHYSNDQDSNLRYQEENDQTLQQLQGTN